MLSPGDSSVQWPSFNKTRVLLTSKAIHIIDWLRIESHCFSGTQNIPGTRRHIVLTSRSGRSYFRSGPLICMTRTCFPLFGVYLVNFLPKREHAMHLPSAMKLLVLDQNNPGNLHGHTS